MFKKCCKKLKVWKYAIAKGRLMVMEVSSFVFVFRRWYIGDAEHVQDGGCSLLVACTAFPERECLFVARSLAGSVCLAGVRAADSDDGMRWLGVPTVWRHAHYTRGLSVHRHKSSQPSYDIKCMMMHTSTVVDFRVPPVDVFAKYVITEGRLLSLFAFVFVK